MKAFIKQHILARVDRKYAIFYYVFVWNCNLLRLVVGLDDMLLRSLFALQYLAI